MACLLLTIDVKCYAVDMVTISLLKNVIIVDTDNKRMNIENCWENK